MSDVRQKERYTVSDWWDGVKAEFGKIVWPSQQTIYRQSVATVVISVIVSIIIVLIDMVIQYGVDFLVGL